MSSGVTVEVLFAAGLEDQNCFPVVHKFRLPHILSVPSQY
jgi:hypothetical protein